jgi:hypothetical protein
MRHRRYDPNVPRLYGMQEAAEYLGITRPNLGMLVNRGRMIEPVAELAATPVWSESQLDEQAFLWRDNPHGQLDPLESKRRTLTRRLRGMERRWDALVESIIDRADRRTIIAFWDDPEKHRRLSGRHSNIASPSEARRALAEAKVLRLVAELRDKDPVFEAIGKQLDEAAGLRKEIESVQQALRERAGEAVSSQG